MNRRSFLKRIAAFGLALALPAGLEGQAATSDPAEIVSYIVNSETIPGTDRNGNYWAVRDRDSECYGDG